MLPSIPVLFQERKQIGKKQSRGTNIIPPLQMPKTYNRHFGSSKKVSRSQLHTRVGNFFPAENPWIIKIREFNPDIYMVKSANGIELIDNNLHVWLG